MHSTTRQVLSQAGMRILGGLGVCVVIPVYQDWLSKNERISLSQCLRVLAKYPTVVMKPASLDLSGLNAEFPSLGTESFPDRFFQGIKGYNALMLSREFYERFAAYDYILIHQLDAFVFEDRLADWCNRGFDYIGAPWVSEKIFSSKFNEQRLKLKRWLYELLDRRRSDTRIYPHPARLLFRSGNGGLSLRRVLAFLRVLDGFKDRAVAAATSDPPLNEDQFFSIEVNHSIPALRIPDYRTASQFAIELCPSLCMQHLNKDHLPFGCHAWDRYETDYWRKHFSAFGHVLPSLAGSSDYYAQARTELKPYIPPLHRRVIEIGCGRGAFRKNLLPQAEVWGLEPVESVAREAEQVLHRVIASDYESARPQLPENYFDLVICNDVIEHMADDRAFLKTIQSKMAPGCYLMGSIPNMRHWPVLKSLVLEREWDYQDEGVLDRTHLRFYTVKSFPTLLKICGFEVLKFEGINRKIDASTRRWLKLLGGLFDDVGYVQFAFLARKRS